jgi:hypothetical protein
VLVTTSTLLLPSMHAPCYRTNGEQLARLGVNELHDARVALGQDLQPTLWCAQAQIRGVANTSTQRHRAAADLPERLRGVPVGGAVAAHVGARRQLVDEALVDLRQRLLKRHCEARRAGGKTRRRSIGDAVWQSCFLLLQTIVCGSDSGKSNFQPFFSHFLLVFAGALGAFIHSSILNDSNSNSNSKIVRRPLFFLFCLFPACSRPIQQGILCSTSTSTMFSTMRCRQYLHRKKSMTSLRGKGGN